jgi:hypothetical protein
MLIHKYMCTPHVASSSLACRQGLSAEPLSHVKIIISAQIFSPFVFQEKGRAMLLMILATKVERCTFFGLRALIGIDTHNL